MSLKNFHIQWKVCSYACHIMDWELLAQWENSDKERLRRKPHSLRISVLNVLWISQGKCVMGAGNYQAENKVSIWDIFLRRPEWYFYFWKHGMFSVTEVFSPAVEHPSCGNRSLEFSLFCFIVSNRTCHCCYIFIFFKSCVWLFFSLAYQVPESRYIVCPPWC